MTNLLKLNERVITSARRLYGAHTFTVTSGQELVVESSPQGLDVLKAGPEGGKVWSVSVDIQIVETEV